MNASSLQLTQDQVQATGQIIKLSPREKEITGLIVNEFSTKQIAGHLYLSIETIKTHRKNIMNKLNAKSVAGIVREAIIRNIISRQELSLSV